MMTKKGSSIFETDPYSVCTVYGWGKINRTKQSLVLKETNLMIWSEQMCLDRTFLPLFKILEGKADRFC